MIAGGALRRGSLVSSASVPAVSKPYMTYALMIPPMMKAPKYPHLRPSPRPRVLNTMPGPRLKWNASRTISSVAPMSSRMTQTLLIRAISLTPIMFTMVVETTRIAPSRIAFLAPPEVR